jgi:hypothetical protein
MKQAKQQQPVLFFYSSCKRRTNGTIMVEVERLFRTTYDEAALSQPSTITGPTDPGVAGTYVDGQFVPSQDTITRNTRIYSKHTSRICF